MKILEKSVQLPAGIISIKFKAFSKVWISRNTMILDTDMFFKMVKSYFRNENTF